MTARSRTVWFIVSVAVFAAMWTTILIQARQSRNLGILVVPVLLWAIPGVIRARSNRWQIAGWVVYAIFYAGFASLAALVGLFANNFCLSDESSCVGDPHGVNGLIILGVLMNPLLIGIGARLAVPAMEDRAALHDAEMVGGHT